MAARRTDNSWNPLADSSEDRNRAKRVTTKPQSDNPAYRLAYTDEDFMCREELRPVRLQLELLKAQMALTEADIRSTVVLFGGARIPEPGRDPWAACNETQRKNLADASCYYDEARAFARICSREAMREECKEYVVATGGGPGVMEAGNRGAADVGAPSIGFNVVLPHEQDPNDYVTPELSFNFHYFAIRKMHFLMRAKAFAIFPGGFGTMDELFETLTLIQTKRMERVPVILFGQEFWNRIVDFDALAEFGTIAPGDTDLLSFVETAEEAWAIVAERYGLERQGASA
ncbi:LOG family protein [Pararhizobium mangrovi]|uniref:AMP nucleosidase n=1 Tax=Pararhizobium mangrovi TaxID=2590452 RepID=A0A506TWV9_9HYPH|nr:LOG family protein [Pararhizobium mangrovi]TPW25786.1 LOG family protein [Pararhizobium mangrovi]